MFGFGSSSSSSQSSSSSSKKSDPPKETIVSFVREDPNGLYTFDADDKAERAELCRKTKDGVSCIKVEATSKKLFETMQNLGFFCALPPAAAQTHMECKPMPK